MNKTLKLYSICILILLFQVRYDIAFSQKNIFTFNDYDFYFDLGDYEYRKYKNKLKVSHLNFDIDSFSSVTFECFSIRYSILDFDLTEKKRRFNSFMDVKIYYPLLNHSNLIEIDSLVENNIYSTIIKINKCTNNYSIHKYFYNKNSDLTSEYSNSYSVNVYLLKSFATTWNETHRLILIYDGSTVLVEFTFKIGNRREFPNYKELLDNWIINHLYIGIVPMVTSNSFEIIIPITGLKYGD